MNKIILIRINDYLLYKVPGSKSKVSYPNIYYKSPEILYIIHTYPIGY